ncbi:MAG: hypothetical protein KBD06_04910 [Candidatus Pacebacteria bacterium]|nr:hypothetical protein [Candidatus Paceibacterota bacterium]
MGIAPTIRQWFDLRTIRNEYRAAFRTPGYIALLIISMIVLCGALYVNFWAIDQATAEAGPHVEDLILSNFPAIEVDGLFVYGTFAVLALTILIVLARPRSIPFIVHGVTLFMIVRSGFTLLTHLGPPEAYYASDFGSTITGAFFGSDQFFSGHTGMTFLAALAYWRIPWIRNLFLLACVYFVAIVLLGHIHYSIDVASAFCITYCIYLVALWAFEKEHAMFLENTTV